MQTLRLAEQLGAETVTLSGATMSDEILAYARSRNVSRVILGKPARSLWKRILLGSIVDSLVRGSGDIDIHVVSGEGEPAAASVPRIRAHAPDWPAYGLAGEGWHPGVIGIVASRIVERYHRPTVLIALDADTGFGSGSGRSIPGFDLLSAAQILEFGLVTTILVMVFCTVLVVEALALWLRHQLR